MSKKLYVGNLSFQATSEQVREYFQAHGEVDKVNVVMDSYSGRSRGFAFVEMMTEEGATAAREACNGQPFQSRNLTVDWAKPETRGGSGSFGEKREFGAGRPAARRF